MIPSKAPYYKDMSVDQLTNEIRRLCDFENPDKDFYGREIAPLVERRELLHREINPS